MLIRKTLDIPGIRLGRRARSTCPNCGAVARRVPYDIGDGPELACITCETCWGAEGQPLTDGPNGWARPNGDDAA